MKFSIEMLPMKAFATQLHAQSDTVFGLYEMARLEDKPTPKSIDRFKRQAVYAQKRILANIVSRNWK